MADSNETPDRTTLKKWTADASPAVIASAAAAITSAAAAIAALNRSQLAIFIIAIIALISAIFSISAIFFGILPGWRRKGLWALGSILFLPVLFILAPDGSIFPVRASGPLCSTTTWNGEPEVAGPDTSPSQQLTGIRTGHQECYDSMVLDMNGPAVGYSVKYVDNIYADPSGKLILINGDAKLQVILKAAAYDSTGKSTYSGVTGQPLPGINLAGYPAFRDAKFAGSFEGLTTVGLGVRARLPFRVIKLGNRVVINVAHRW